MISLGFEVVCAGLWCFVVWFVVFCGDLSATLSKWSLKIGGQLIRVVVSTILTVLMVRRPASSVRPSSTMLRHLLPRNHSADQSQILCGASLGRGNRILFAACGSHDQDGRQAHIWQKPFKNLLLRNWSADFHETWYVASGTPAHYSLFK